MAQDESQCDVCGEPVAARQKCRGCGAYKFDVDPVGEPAWAGAARQAAPAQAPPAPVLAPPAPALELPRARPLMEPAPLAPTRASANAPDTSAAAARTARWREVNASSSRIAWWAVRAPVIGVLLLFSISYWRGSWWGFLDGVNLAFHEFGHLFFAWGGETLGFLGGTLFEMLLPLGFTIYFAIKRQGFSAGVTLWWFFQTFPHTGRYMIDAEHQLLTLLGGGHHDWVFLFTRWGVKEHAVSIGIAVRTIGYWGMAACLLGLVLWVVFAPQRTVEADQLEGL